MSICIPVIPILIAILSVGSSEVCGEELTLLWNVEEN